MDRTELEIKLSRMLREAAAYFERDDISAEEKEKMFGSIRHSYLVNKEENHSDTTGGK